MPRTTLAATCVVLGGVAACADVLGLDVFHVDGEGGAGGAPSASANASSGSGATSGTTTGSGSVSNASATSTADSTSGPSSTSSGGPVDIYAESVLADGPILYLRFEESDSSQPMNNSAENPIVAGGIYGATTPVPGGGILGSGAIELGANQNAFIDFPELHFEGVTAFSVEMWARYETNTNTDWEIPHIGTWDGGVAGWALFALVDPSDIATAEFKRNEQANAVLSPPLANAFTSYHHLVGVFEPSVGPGVYVNGVATGPGAGGNVILLEGTGFKLRGPAGAGTLLRIDEVAVYPIMLDQTSIEARCSMVLGSCP